MFLKDSAGQMASDLDRPPQRCKLDFVLGINCCCSFCRCWSAGGTNQRALLFINGRRRYYYSYYRLLEAKESSLSPSRSNNWDLGHTEPRGLPCEWNGQIVIG